MAEKSSTAKNGVSSTFSLSLTLKKSWEKIFKIWFSSVLCALIKIYLKIKNVKTSGKKIFNEIASLICKIPISILSNFE